MVDSDKSTNIIPMSTQQLHEPLQNINISYTHDLDSSSGDVGGGGGAMEMTSPPRAASVSENRGQRGSVTSASGAAVVNPYMDGSVESLAAFNSTDYNDHQW